PTFPAIPLPRAASASWPLRAVRDSAGPLTKRNAVAGGQQNACYVLTVDQQVRRRDLSVKRLTPAMVSLAMIFVVGLLVTGYFAKMLLADEPKPRLTISRPVSVRDVPVAVAPIEPGTKITPAHLLLRSVRTDALAADALFQDKSIVGRIVKEPIAAN